MTLDATLSSSGSMAVSASSDSCVGRRSRRTDPGTSHAAAARAAKFAASHSGRIVAALEQWGSATAGELAAITGLTVVQVDRRACELIRAGKVRVLTMHGKDVTRDGFRVLAAVDPCYFSSDEAHAA